MLPRSVRRAAAAAVAAALALSGCVKLKQRTLVLPDGSGRLTMTVGISTEMFDEARKKAAAEGAAVPEKPDLFEKMRDPADFCEGFVAASPVEKSERDGFAYATFTLWFEDVNRLRIRKVGEGAAADSADDVSFRLERTAAGGTLTVQNGLMGDDDVPGAPPAGGEMKMPPELEAQLAEMVKKMFRGFEMSESYEVPGDVTSVEGLPDRAGRTASLSITDADMTDPKKAEKLRQTRRRTIRFGPPTVPETDLAAFRADFAKARADFDRRVAAGLAKPAPKVAPRAASAGGPAPAATPETPAPESPDAPPPGRERTRIRKKTAE